MRTLTRPHSEVTKVDRTTATFAQSRCSHFSRALLSLAELLSGWRLGRTSSRLAWSCGSVEVLAGAYWWAIWTCKMPPGVWVCTASPLHPQTGHLCRRASPEGLVAHWIPCPAWKQHVNPLSEGSMFTGSLWTGSLEEADSNAEFAPVPFVSGPSASFYCACAGAQGRVCVSCFLSIGLNVLSDHVIVCVWWAIWKLWGFRSVLGI